MRHGLPLLFKLTLVGAWAVGCRVYDPSLVQGGTDGGTPDCALEKPPERPAGADGDEGGEVVFALHDVVFDQSGGHWERVGYDLDGYCTVPPDFRRACDPPGESSPEVDGLGGIDNSFGHNLYPLVDLAVGDLEEASRDSMDAGVGAVLLIVRGWNGEANDPRVEARLAVSVHGTTGEPGEGPPEALTGPEGLRDPGGEPMPPPAYDGNDWFWVRPDNFFEGDLERPRIVDDNAYVRDRTLFLTIPEATDFVFPGEGAGVNVRMHGSFATAELSEDGQRIVKATVSGRWGLIDLLDTAEALGLCEGTDQYDLLNNQLQRIADIRIREGEAGEGLTCNAISLGIELEGVRARIAEAAEPLPLVDACAEGEGDGGGESGG